MLKLIFPELDYPKNLNMFCRPKKPKIMKNSGNFQRNASLIYEMNFSSLLLILSDYSISLNSDNKLMAIISLATCISVIFHDSVF